ncbi:MAG: glycosyltransferase family 2 protein [Rhodospirillales bacterium]|nr:glycosyltransferase family 2 protein [Rhodospirillales bacterium]
MISVIVPVYNEQDNVEPLIKELMAASEMLPISEFIYVDDASTDRTQETLRQIRESTPLLRIIRHSVRSGQSAAFMTGVRAAGNSLVALMDGDGQNNPADIKQLYECFRDNEKNNKKIMVAGWRMKRQDSSLRRISSKLANGIRSFFLGDGVKDTGCSLKLIRREDYLRLPYFNHMHRFLPALLHRDHVQICQVGVSHRPRIAGKSKYGFWNRFWVGILDLFGVKWLLSRGFSEKLSVREIL